jgi:threonine dehydrogenase-like Zn-dependent dehydrogenase
VTEMTAVRTWGPRDYRVEAVSVPEPGPNEVQIQIGACGICASDMKCYLGGPLFWGSNGAGGYVEPPCIAGHEFAGRVVAMGPGAAEKHGLSVGDRIVAEQIVPCNECRYCLSGHYWMCMRHIIFGFKQQLSGGMASYAILPENALLHRVPESLSEEEAAYIEPAACAWHAVDRGEIKAGDVVVICGVGNIGLCMLQIARMRNPGMVIALDAKPDRLAIASQLGADRSINVLEEDAVAIVRELTGGYGCDVFIEASGNPAAIDSGLQMIRKLGTFVEFSVFNEPATINWTIIGDTKELNIHGSHLGPHCYPQTIAALADGSLDVKPLLAKSWPIGQFEQAMNAALSGAALKQFILPGA